MNKDLKIVAREMTEVQGWSGNWDCDPYMHGMYNGMEYMLALIEERQPEFRDAPTRWKSVEVRIQSFIYPVVRFIGKLYDKFFGPKPVVEPIDIR